MKNIFTFLIVFISFTTIVSAQTSEKKKNVLEIFVNNNGEIILKDKNVTMQKLEREIKRISRKKGVIHYSRVFKGNKVKETSSKVIQLIAKYKLPIKYYTDKTFTKIADW